MIDLGPVQFLRPFWLAALLLLPLLFRVVRRHRDAAPGLRAVVDPHLLPHLLEGGDAPRRAWWPWVAASAYLLAVVALAGPSWRQQEQPLWQTQQPLVVAVDLSSAMLAPDLPPSRLAQLRARLHRLFRQPSTGQVGLVGFAGDAFTVAPLTDDAANVDLFVDALHPDVMPVDGQLVDRAIDASVRLIEQAGFRQGRIVVVTDHADAAAQRAARRAREAGHTVSVMGIGTAAGAPVRTSAGRTVQVALDEGSLRALAREGGGGYATLAHTGTDDALFATAAGPGTQRGRQGGSVPADEGFRFVPLVMLLVLLLLLLLRGPRVLALLLVLGLAVPPPGHAASLWRRPDQQAHALMREGVKDYRRGNFDAAARRFAGLDTADAHYNRGNALARAGDLPGAVAAYDRALQRQPGMPDAVANRRAVLEAMKRQGAGQGSRNGKGDSKGAGRNQPQPCRPGDPGCQAQRPGREAGGKSPAPAPSPQAAARPPDARQQAQADAAQRARMQRALQAAGNAGRVPPQARTPTPAQRERQLANDAALKRVPDQPGNLLREKFRIEYERRQGSGGP